MPWQRFSGARAAGSDQRTPIEVLPIVSWPEGWRPDLAEVQLSQQALADVLNIQFTESAGVRKRRGFEIITDAVGGARETTSVDRGTASGGTFTLTYNNETTSAIAYDASAATVEAAVEALGNVDDATVTGTGTSGDPWLIQVQDDYGYGVTGTSSLSGGSLTVTQSVQGISDVDFPDHVLIIPVQSINSSWVVYEQVVLYFNEKDGNVFHASLGELVKENANPGTVNDLQNSGISVGRWENRIGPRAWNINTLVYGDNIYVTSQRQNARSSNGNTDQTNAGLINSVSKPFKYDRGDETFTFLPVAALDGTANQFPAARAAVAQYNRFFCANIVRHTDNGGSVSLNYRYPSRIYWSGVDDPETWEANSYITVGSDDDGSEITALVPFRGSILVFKNNSVWTLVGTDTDTFAVYSLSNRRGSEGTYAVWSTEEFCYFLDTTEGVMSYDGVRFTNISTTINDDLMSDLNRLALFKAVMWSDDRRLYLSVPVGDHSSGSADLPTRTYVYDLELKNWTKWDIGFMPRPVQYFADTALSNSVSPNGEWYGAGINDTSGVAQVNVGNTDNGTAIDAFFETGWINPGELGDQHRLRRLDVLAEIEGDTIDITLYRNFQTATWLTGTLTPTGSLVGWHEQQPTYDQGMWSWLKLRFANDTDDETFQIEGLGISYSNRRHPRRDLGIT